MCVRSGLAHGLDTAVVQSWSGELLAVEEASHT